MNMVRLLGWGYLMNDYIIYCRLFARHLAVRSSSINIVGIVEDYQGNKVIRFDCKGVPYLGVVNPDNVPQIYRRV